MVLATADAGGNGRQAGRRRALSRGSNYSPGLSGAPGRPFGYSSRNRSATACGTSSSTLPPNAAISLTPLDETNANCGSGHHVHRLDLGRKQVVEAVHLHLPLEVGEHAKPFDHRPRAVTTREVDDQLGEDVDHHVLLPGKRILEEGDALLDRERRLLVQRLANDPDDHLVEHRRRPPDHVYVTEGDRVVRPGADGDDGVLSIGHDAGALTG